jgi:Concanavalin A-like lectin/glucanases superfamily/Immunoglobulin domain
MEGNGADKTRYFIRDINGTVKDQIVGAKPTLDGTWHHVAYTYDANTGEFLVYVDGQLDGTNTFTYAKNLASWDQVAIGALVRNNVGVPFYGMVDDVALWARVLSQGEVQDVMTNSITTPVNPIYAPVVTVQPGGATLYAGDNFALSAGVYGSRPLYYQWTKDGTNYPGATAATLPLSNVTTDETGAYRLVVTNATSISVTSAVAQVTVNGYAAPDLTNGIVAYWPLDTITGVKTPDLVSAYDMTVAGTTLPSVVPGKWGNALSLSAANSQFARYLANPGDALPIYSKSNFTVSFWVKAPYNSAGGWAFSESSTLSTSPAFCTGIKDNTTSTGIDTFVRDNNGQPSGTHVFNASPVVWDDTWHNVVWVQHDAGGTPVAQVYVDGAFSLNPAPRYPVTPNNTALGCFGRATPSQFLTGLIDEVVIWERPLSSAEIAMLPNVYITNPPVRIQPLAINSFKSDLPAVASADSTVLRWDVPASADSVAIDQVGDVTGLTVSGVGFTSVTPASTTAYVLTATRNTAAFGTEVVKATNVVGVVSGVAADWSLLDNFDFYSPGSLGAYGWWVDVGGGNSVSVVTNSYNRMVKTLTSASGAYLPLKGLTVNSNQSATLYFRMIPAGSPADVLRQYLGITDRPGNFPYQYTGGNIGPAVQPTVNDPSQNPGDWLLAARNIPYEPLTFATNVLQVGAAYSVWIDVTNVFIGDRAFPNNYDVFSVYIQKEGDMGRTPLFTNFVSDRDLLADDPLTGGLPTDPLTRVYLCGSSDTDSALFDDFYLSKSGYNSTIPRAAGYAGPAPTLSIQWNGSQWEIVFEGKLEEASSITGKWTEVSGASSPHPIMATGTPDFYRAVYN